MANQANITLAKAMGLKVTDAVEHRAPHAPPGEVLMCRV